MSGLSLTGLRTQPFIPYLSKQEDAKPHALESDVATLNLIGSDEKEDASFTQADNNPQLLFSNKELRDMMVAVNSRLAHPIVYQAEPDEVSGVNTQTDIAESASIAESINFDEGNKAEYAQALLGEVHALLEKIKYENRSDFEEACKIVGPFEKNFNAFENSLKGIEKLFKDESIFEKIPENISEKKLQSFMEKMTKAEVALKPLISTLQNIKEIIQSFKNQLPTKTQAYLWHTVTFAASIVSVVLISLSISAAIITIPIALIGLSWESWKFFLERKIEKWEAFESALENLKKHSPIKEKKVFQALSTHMAQVHTLVDTAVSTVNQTTQATTQELENTKAELVETKQKLAEVETQMLARLRALEARLGSEQPQAESSALISEKSANTTKTESMLRLVA